MLNLTNIKYWDSAWERKLKKRKYLIVDKSWPILIRKVLSFTENKEKMLEIGVAPGIMAETYKEACPDLNIDGMDISEQGLKVTRERYFKRKIIGELYHEDFMKNKNRSNRYDLVCSHGLIEHFKNFREAIERHFAYAKVGGIIFITIPNYNNRVVVRLLKSFAKETIITHNFECMSKNRLVETISSLKGKIIDYGEFGGPMLPNSTVNKGIAGFLYKQLARSWNIFISVLSLLSKNALNDCLWNSNIYCVARKCI